MYALLLQDGNGQFPFPKLIERGSTFSVVSEGIGVPDASLEHTDAVLKGIAINQETFYFLCIQLSAQTYIL